MLYILVNEIAALHKQTHDILFRITFFMQSLFTYFRVMEGKQASFQCIATFWKRVQSKKLYNKNVP